MTLPKGDALRYGWTRFEENNRAMRDVAMAHGAAFLDVYKLTAMRTRGYHVRSSRVDCLHTCLPGPVDDWNALLFASFL